MVDEGFRGCLLRDRAAVRRLVRKTCRPGEILEAVTPSVGETTMNEEEKLNEAKDAAEKQAEEAKDAVADQDEFKLTVRKLEMPVRPRGVLAE